jgi:hypothetical protein
MDDESLGKRPNFEIGDIVQESSYIIPPDRKAWVGIVVFIDRNHYEFFSISGTKETLIAVHWFQVEYVESLPASVLRLIQKAKIKIEKNP